MTKRALIVLASLSVAVGCGQAKDRDERVVHVENAGVRSESQSSKLSDDLHSLQQFIELYFEGDAISRDAMANLFNKYKDKLVPFLKGMNLSANELIDILFSFDRNGDGKLGVSELADEVARRIPILRWIKDNQTSVTPEELLLAIKAEYPKATLGACVGLQNSLLRFDEIWAGGNADGLISRREISHAGLSLAVIAQIDLKEPLKRPDNAPQEEKLAFESLERMLGQQIYGRHTQFDYKQLADADLRLELASFYLQSDLIGRLVRAYGTQGEIHKKVQPRAIEAYGFARHGHWAYGRELFDHKMMGGDGNSTLGYTETLLYLSQLKYASKLSSITGGNFASKHVRSVDGHKRMLWSLVTIYPRTGQDLFTRDGYWDSLVAYDEKELGGNSDGKLDIGEVSVALSFAQITENLFAIYDTNSDRNLSKTEVSVLFNQLGLSDKRTLDLFFSDLALEDKEPGFFKKLKIFFTGVGGANILGPFEFYKRIVKVMPNVLSGKPLAPPRRGD